MTSTSFNVGLNDGTRLSSRVLRPPGGGHTDIFGGEPEPPRGRRMAPPAAASQIGPVDEPAQPTNGDTPSQNGQASETPTSIAPQTPPEPTPQAQPQPQPQPTPEARTPEEKTPEAPVAAPKAVTPTEKNEPPKRVRVPPGGFSSGLW